ncbi:MAG: autophagy protein atg9 [Trizodia sp. TS-e1964]|nr:MAG: autophagy protein atg9 [Trizodia sp. TS-e1964]
MAPNILSRLLPTTTGLPSVYETIRQHDESSEISDFEDRAGLALDEENLGQRFKDFELDHNNVEESQIGMDGSSYLGKTDHRPPQRQQSFGIRPRWMADSARIRDIDDGDDEVPASLLIEGPDDRPTGTAARETTGPSGQPPLPRTAIPGPSTTAARSLWQATQAQQRLHLNEQESAATNPQLFSTKTSIGLISPKQKALWLWANVDNLDNFLRDVYDYFLDNGIRCILLSRILNLLTLAFVVGFTTFLTMCVDYSKIRDSTKMSEILIPQCTKKMSGSANTLLWLFSLIWVIKLFQYVVDIRRLIHMHNFYLYLLEIPDSDIQTISWQEVIVRLMALRDSNINTADSIAAKHRKFTGSQSKQRMDAHDIANRLMRKENYLIALFNKEILDLTLPIPFLRNRQIFSKTMEWNLSMAILDYVFNEQGHVRPIFLKLSHRRALSAGLKRRFIFAGTMNVICAPFIVLYLIMLYFFRYFNEYQRNPSQLGSRQYTPLAEWKFREFNELWHLFQRRTNMSYPFASRYVDQFPKDKTVQLCRFIAFVTGALASVLALASVVDPELFLGFEITPERTVLFYISVLGTVWAVARGAVPEESLVFDPEFALKNVIEFTHYLPAQWRGHLHSNEVKTEFSMLYQMKILIFLEEILSIIFTPFVLWFSLPKCSDDVVDFFREFTIHVDGLGYVCSFAVFDFKKGGNNVAQQRPAEDDGGVGLRDDYYSTKDGKMLASYYGFIDNYVTNPRGGLHAINTPNKRQFHSPQTLPGVMSPTLGNSRQDRSVRRERYPPRPPQSNLAPPNRTPRFPPGAAPVSMSPMPSMLLDPHNQPANSGLKSAQHRTSQSRYRSRHNVTQDPIEDEENINMPGGEQHASGSAAENAGDESNLGDSWKTTRAAALDADEEDVDTVAGGGVLGLLQQFQRAQRDGRGAGVNI